MQEADADDALTGADVLGGAGAGLGVNLNVLVQIDQVLDAFVMAVLLDHGVDDQLGGAGGVVVGQPDQALVLGLEQVGPILRSLKTHALELVGVDHEAKDAGVDAVPVTVSVLVLGLGDVRGVLRLIGLEQTLGRADVVGIGRAAEPDVGRRIAVLFLDLGLHLTGGQTLILDLDAVHLLEVLTGGGEVLLLAGAVDHELALGLGGVDEAGLFGALLIVSGGLGVVLLAAAGDQAERHHQAEEQSNELFHANFPPIQNLSGGHRERSRSHQIAKILQLIRNDGKKICRT